MSSLILLGEGLLSSLTKGGGIIILMLLQMHLCLQLTALFRQTDTLLQYIAAIGTFGEFIVALLEYIRKRK